MNDFMRFLVEIIMLTEAFVLLIYDNIHVYVSQAYMW